MISRKAKCTVSGANSFLFHGRNDPAVFDQLQCIFGGFAPLVLRNGAPFASPHPHWRAVQFHRAGNIRPERRGDFFQLLRQRLRPPRRHGNARKNKASRPGAERRPGFVHIEEKHRGSPCKNLREKEGRRQKEQPCSAESRYGSIRQPRKAISAAGEISGIFGRLSSGFRVFFGYFLPRRKH